ncbi:A/G-specific DNA-adenine glycosylase [Alteribacillus persepolensis]|uniref:Adenine DNA glycosylase n=1 Tax=Alteribacillus persepolensis TaxID=568899 RepID=A0A1G8CCZ1_9BACI|nr:A/G-specific adenine glycosylase [Alteribacillus persepolensis]SDH43312.1 A/G-specific DNA-adenine glycosylase [Alteribacillus persepolensis]
MEQQLENIDIKRFQQDLISWYEDHKRDLPWRQNQDPYRVWVSEVMLQQTKVDTVIPYYNRFMQQFPTPQKLAEADEEDVMKAWEGLGYYSRVRNLQSAVREVVADYGGEVPSSKKAFSSLKGVGPYTAGAVLSIAYEKPEPAVDGNVMRVFSRILLSREDIGKAKTRKKFESLLPAFLNDAKPSQFNQAVMELGALVCTPTSPGCLLCPVQYHCMARAEGVQEELPVKEKKKAPAKKEMAAVILCDQQGKTLFHQRGESGLLARLWEYPNVETKQKGEQKDTLSQFLKNTYGVQAKIGNKVQKVQHVFSHLIWNITVYEGMIEEAPEHSQDCKWLTLEEAQKYAFPVSHQKILKAQIERRDAEWN